MPSLESSADLQHETKIWDRFIRNRNKIQNRFLDVPEEVPASKDAIIKQKPYSSSEETYKYLVASALSLNPTMKPWVPQWPVKPRRNPNLKSPRIVLDLPNIRRSLFCSNMMDWSATDYLTVAFPRSVYLWHSTTNRTIKLVCKSTSCLKWNNDGSTLFLANRDGSYMVADVNAVDDVISSKNSCHVECFTTSCVFHQRSPIAFTGCSLGSVSVYHVNKGLSLISVFHEDHSHDSYITKLSLSCDGRHLAIGGMTNLVFIYDTYSFTLQYNIVLAAPTRALEWHPWKRNLLVVSDCNGFMGLYDTLAFPNWRPLASYQSAVDSSILNLSFNPITAELVVSQRVYFSAADRNIHSESPGRYSAQLSVLSSFDRVVDTISGHLGSVVHYLSWNPDGTQLATAGADETAQIWDFLPSDTKQRTKIQSCKLNYATASLELGNKMGLAIR